MNEGQLSVPLFNLKGCFMEILKADEVDKERIIECLRSHNKNFMHSFEDFSLIIKEGDVIAGGIVAESMSDLLEIEFLYVNPAFRGKGYGKKLLESVEKEAKEKGIKRILLNTYSFQAPGFYQQMGYEEILSVDPVFDNFSWHHFEKLI